MPIFDAPVLGPLQNLFAPNQDTIVKADGFTYVKDNANKGTNRLQLQGVKAILDGIDGKIINGNVGNTQYSYVWVKQVVDNQILFSLANTTTTAISVVAGVLTFGGSLTVNNIYVDGVSKTAPQAGVILNDNAVHNLYIDYDQIATSNLVLGYDGTTYGNIELFDFRCGDAVEPISDVNLVYDNPNALFSTETDIWHLDENSGTTNYDSSGNANDGTASGGVTWGTQDVVSFQNYYGYNKPAAVYIPAKLDSANPTVDVLDNALAFLGKAPKDGRLVESHNSTLDGIGDFIDTGVAFSPSGDYEISGWFKANATASTLTFIDTRDGSADGLQIQIKATTSVLRLLHNASDIETLSAYDDGVWHKVVVSRIGSTISLAVYNISGALEETVITTTDATALNTTTNSIIGARSFISQVINWDGELIDIKAVDGSTTIFHYPLAESAGLVAYDKSGNDNHGAITATEGAFWANTQDLVHNNLLSGGYSLYEHATSDPILVPYGSNGQPLSITPPTGYTLTEDRPSGRWHNGAETKVNTNYTPDPELVYRGSIPLDNLIHNSDTFVRDEYMNKNDLAKSKDYVVYDKNTTSEQGDKIDTAIGN